MPNNLPLAYLGSYITEEAGVGGNGLMVPFAHVGHQYLLHLPNGLNGTPAPYPAVTTNTPKRANRAGCGRPSDLVEHHRLSDRGTPHAHFHNFSHTVRALSP